MGATGYDPLHPLGPNFYRPHPKDGGTYCFQFVCQSTSRGGYPSQIWGGNPSKVWLAGEYPFLALAGWGVPHPRSGGLRRGYPIPGLDGGYPPNQVRIGYPQPGLDGVPPRPGMGNPPGPGMGYPPGPGMVPPGPGMGYPPDLGRGTPLTWDIASTCYAAGSMPVAFTQEDFLVFSIFMQFLEKFGQILEVGGLLSGKSWIRHWDFCSKFRIR